jgi:hypothetical protein
MSNPINTFPLQQFIQQVKAAELAQQKEIKIDIKSARTIALSLAEISAKLLEDYDKMFQKLQESQGGGDITVKMDGGGFSSN